MNNNNNCICTSLTLIFFLLGNSVCHADQISELDVAGYKNIYSRNNAFPGDSISLSQVLEYTMYNQPEIQSKINDINYARGEVLIESGEFDPQLEAFINHGENKDTYFDTDDNDSPISVQLDRSFMDFTVDVQKRFRGGQTASIGYTVDYEDITDSGVGGTSEAEVYIELIQPLLKERGSDATGASEKAAKTVLEAREYDLRDSVSESIYNTAEAYWDYLAAKKILEIRRDVTYPIENLVTSFEEIQKRQSEKLSLEEIEAELFSRKTDLVEAKQEYVIARHNLGLTMGIASFNDIEALPEPDTEFVQFNDDELEMIRSSLPVYLKKAEHQRASVLSLKRLQDSNRLLIGSAKRNIEPQLDLVARYGYFGSETQSSIRNSFDAIRENSDPSWLIGGVLRYPLGNNEAKGELVQQKSLMRDLNLQLYNSLREISSNIIVTVKEIVNTTKEIELTSQSISLYAKSLVRQRDDLLADSDVGSLLDFISVQDDWIDARVSEIMQKSRLMKSIAKLVYETGDTLETNEYKINVSKYTAVPQ